MIQVIIHLLLIFLIIANVLRPRLTYCNVEDVILDRDVQVASQFRNIGYHYIMSEGGRYDWNLVPGFNYVPFVPWG